jgi:DeoR family transcriptional regulator, glycerol-3-phosphate regulon repressor
LLRKIHGSAVSIQTGVESSFARRRTEQLEAKRVIAQLAAPLFHPGDSLLVDAGTTTAVFASELLRMHGLKVFTNSWEVASMLGRGECDHEIFLLGGSLDVEIGQTKGPLLVKQLQAIYTDYAVISCGGLDPAMGLMHYSLEEAQIARAMIDRCKSLVVLANSEKMGRKALYQMIGFTEVDKLVTEAPPPPKIARALLQADVEVVFPRT